MDIIHQSGVLTTGIETTGWDAVLRRISEHKRQRSKENLSNAALKGAQYAKDRLIEDMSLPKSGRHYPGDRVPASAEGETPAIQTGDLAKNTDAVRGPSTASKGVAYLDSKGEHALWMEFGWTTRDGQVHYRPFQRTIVARFRSEIMAEMKL